MRWGVRHADGHVETWAIVTTREGARQAAKDEDEDCTCGGPHRVADTATIPNRQDGPGAS